ncbi:AAEL012907-PA [Aedes aegypti]|uniref:AAEL012907-PA n=1 Tax=Aedes aegypti TaxID=7159 RepID=Q16KQ5_AEDAE|nr:AAEL012907-PA [Aedes aegypti]
MFTEGEIGCSFLVNPVITSGKPFFGLNVQGGFKTETDISVAALAITKPFASLKLTIANLNKSLPLSTVTLDDAARGIIFLYNGIVGPIDGFVQAIADSATDKSTFSTFLFDRIYVALYLAEQFIDVTPKYLSMVAAFSPTIGGEIKALVGEIQVIIEDLSSTMATFEEAVTGIWSNSQITPSSIYSVLNKYRLANLIGALDAFSYQMNTLKGLIADVISAITTADASMSTYTATLTTAFASLDNSLSSSYNSITNVASEFIKQISSSVTKLSTTVDNFNKQINAFNDDIIKPNATAIISLTSEFTFFYNYFMGVLQPNSEEKINSVAYMVTDSVQTAAKDVLYNAYQALNNAMGNLPAKASTCVSTYLSPMVTSLSLSIPTMASCLNLLDAPSVANEQVALLNKLLDDRLTYVTAWTNAISGVTSSSAASVRKTATLKLLAETPSGNIDVHQPALAESYSIFAQLVSNFNSRQNRVVMCLTLKGVDLSAMVISASNGYFGCIRGY